MDIAPSPKKTRPIFDDGGRVRTDVRSFGPVERIFARLAVDAFERVNRADPQCSFAVLVAAIHHRPVPAVRIAGLDLQLLKERRSGRKTVGRGHVQAYPNVTFAILKQGLQFVFTKTFRVHGIVAIADELLALPVKSHEAIAHRPKP